MVQSAKNNKAHPDGLLLGVGMDNEDGHRRVTRGDNFYLVGGSEETHERMTETAIKLNEKLARRGKTLGEASSEELRDILRDITGKA